MPPEDDNQVFDDKVNNQECDEDCELFCPADLMSFAWQIARGMVRRHCYAQVFSWMNDLSYLAVWA